MFVYPRKKKTKRCINIRRIGIALTLSSASLPLMADDNVGSSTSSFDAGFLRGLGQEIDLSRYSRKGGIAPGRYTIDMVINGEERLRQEVRVIEREDLQPQFCFTKADVYRWGVKPEKLPNQQHVKQLLASDCIIVSDLIPDASFTMDISDLSGALSIPQAWAGRIRRGYVDPIEWDEGITAGLLGYKLNAFGGQIGDTTYTANINAGFNIAGWRLRHNGNWQHSGDEHSYQNQNSYVQKDIDSLRAQMTFGEYFTPGNDFDSIPFIGAQLASDDSMLPESERGFAPVIRGIAQSNARVTIRQSGNVIYETSVAPGPFVIDDLYATGYAGDLDVTVTEADGQKKSFTVPFAAVVQMLRPGASRYNLSAGRYRDNELHNAPLFIQGNYRRGINNSLTLYSGGILGEDYFSVLAGTAFGTSYGALAFDATISHARHLPTSEFTERGETLSGRSYRVSYSKLVDTTRTNLSVAAYRFSSKGFLSFGDFAQLRGAGTETVLRERNRFQLSVSQPIGELGDLHFNGITRNYWDGQPSSTTFQFGYGKNFSWGYMNLSASRELQNGKANNTAMLSFSIPLGNSIHRPLLTTTGTSSSNNSSLRTSLSGSAGEYNAMNYNLYTSRIDGSNESYGGSLNYRSSMSQLGASYSHTGSGNTFSASASGTVVAHKDGMVLSPERGETMALMVAEGASGAAVANRMGNSLDSDGQALVAGLRPYQRNQLTVSPKGLPVNVELETTSQNAVPRRGAVVRLDYPTVNGRPLLLQVTNQKLPFGANVVDRKGETVSVVGQGGLIFIRGEYEGLSVIWGSENKETCHLSWQVHDSAEDRAYQQVAARCDN